MENNFIRNIVPESVHWIVYVAVALLIAIVIVMLMNVSIDWSMFDPRPRDRIVKASAKLYMEPSLKQFTNMTAKTDKDFEFTEYSVLFDCVLYNSRNYVTTEGPYRHLLHHGSDELKATTVGGIMVSGCAANGGRDLPQHGLPSRMNPGIFLDPNLNDILIFVDTSNGTETYRESVRIPDVPLDTPFRLGLVVKKNLLEVYVNCQLEITKLLTGVPKAVDLNWYGLAGGAAASAQVQNVYVWPRRALSSADMAAVCGSKLPTFSVRRPTCDGVDTAVVAGPAVVSKTISAATSVDLGLGAAINGSCTA